jgi:glycosyltransferase involved in cell wall biosynthesis
MWRCSSPATTRRRPSPRWSDFHRALPDATVYVYDNNSTDRTCEEAIAGWEGTVVRHERAQGKGNVIRRMFREIDADCYIITDGDDTYPAAVAPELVAKVLEHQADMVVGDRLSSTSRPYMADYLMRLAEEELA